VLPKIQARILLMCLLCFAAPPADAAPILLVEFTHNVTAVEAGDPLPTTVPFAFAANKPHPNGVNYVYWSAEYGSIDVGMSFLAPPSVVDGANQAIMSAMTNYDLETGPANFYGPILSLAPPGSCDINGCFKVFVDDVSKHIVTSVQRVVDKLSITRTQGDFYSLEATQRIQIWSVAVPESSTIALFAVAFSRAFLLRQSAIRCQLFAASGRYCYTNDLMTGAVKIGDSTNVW
jgi:hypothetical protein